MPEPTNRLSGWLSRVEELDLPPDTLKCAREFIFLHVFSDYYSDAQLKEKRRSYRRARRIARWGEAHCARMILMIEGVLALRELGLASYTPPRGRPRKKR